MPVTPNNPPNFITNPQGATPTQLVQDGAFVSNANPIAVVITSGGGGGTSTTVSNLYSVITAFVDANGTCSVGNTLQNTQTYSPTGTLTSSIWINLSGSFTLAAAPPVADVALQSSSPLTNAQFQANFPLPNKLSLAGTDVSAGNPLPVSLVNGGAQIQFVVLQFTATAAGTGYSTGDFLEQIQEWNVVTSPATFVTTIWRNATTNATIGTPANGTYVATAATATSVAVTNLAATLGQKTMAGSAAVVLASDQSAVPTTTTQLPATLGAKTIANSTSVSVASDQIVPVSSTQLPATLGVKTGATSTSVVLASDQAAVPVTSTQLPVALGQTTMAASLPVTLASNQSALPVTAAQLPTALGAQVIAASTAVNIASDQVVPVSATALPLPIGAATSALQTAGNTSLTTIATQTTAIAGQLPATLGNKLSAASLSTTIASNDPVSTSLTAINGKLNSDVSGYLQVNVAAGNIAAENPSVSVTGTAVPTYGTYLGANLAGNLTGLTATANGLKVDGTAVTQPVSAVQLPPALGPQSSANSLSVYVQNPSSGAVAAVANFTVITQFTLGAVTSNVGDYLQEINIYNAAGVYVSTTWQNITQGLPLTGAPPAADVQIISGSDATAALQIAGNNTLTAISGKLPALLGAQAATGSLSVVPATSATFATSTTQLAATLGAKTSANSASVVLASDQANVPVVLQTGTNSIGTVTAAQPTAANLNATVVGTAGAALATAAQLPTTLGAQAVGASLSIVPATSSTFATTSAQLPATLGTKTSALSTSVVLASDQAAIPVTVTSTNPAAIFSLQQTMTTSAVAMASNVLTNGVVITAASTNTGIVYVGPTGVTTSNGYALIAGQSISYGVTNTSAIFLRSTVAGDIVYATGN